jgi:hypothetical protein
MDIDVKSPWFTIVVVIFMFVVGRVFYFIRQKRDKKRYMFIDYILDNSSLVLRVLFLVVPLLFLFLVFPFLLLFSKNEPAYSDLTIWMVGGIGLFMLIGGLYVGYQNTKHLKENSQTESEVSGQKVNLQSSSSSSEYGLVYLVPVFVLVVLYVNSPHVFLNPLISWVLIAFAIGGVLVFVFSKIRSE